MTARIRGRRSAVGGLITDYRAWPGSTTLVASADVQQEKKIKTAGRVASDPVKS